VFYILFLHDALPIFLREKRTKEIRFSLNPSLFGFFWTVGSLFFFFLLFRSQLIHYDNFSHWGIVVKQMLSTDAFPTAQSNLIDRSEEHTSELQSRFD